MGQNTIFRYRRTEIILHILLVQQSHSAVLSVSLHLLSLSVPPKQKSVTVPSCPIFKQYDVYVKAQKTDS